MNPISELREKFLPYGMFILHYSSINSLWTCEFQFTGNEAVTFHKTNLTDLIDELGIVLDNFKKTYKPGYIR